MSKPKTDQFTRIELGSIVRDCVTGFSGIAIARLDHLFNDSEIQIQPQRLDENGKPAEPMWFYENRIEVQS